MVKHKKNSEITENQENFNFIVNVDVFVYSELFIASQYQFTISSSGIFFCVELRNIIYSGVSIYKSSIPITYYIFSCVLWTRIIFEILYNGFLFKFLYNLFQLFYSLLIYP